MKNIGLRVRMSEIEKKKIQQNAMKNNFKSVSEYLRFLGLNANITVNIDEKTNN